jgi:ornithine carbamoyltransferase
VTVAAPPVPAHLLRVSDLDAESLAALLDLSAAMKSRPHGFVDTLRGETVVCFFEKPSTRTRVSFAAAATAPVVNALTDDHHPCQALGGRRRTACPPRRRSSLR